MKTTVQYEHLLEAARQGIISEDQAQNLWAFFAKKEQLPEMNDTPISKFLYYFGALIVIGAMSWFMNTSWEQFGGTGLCAIAVTYASCFIIAGRYFAKHSATLSGLLYIMAVCMTPLAMFGLQKALGLWPQNYPGYFKDFHVYINSGWFVMELATLITGLAALKFARISFVTVPIAFTLWYMSMDVTPIIYGVDYHWTARKFVSIGFGLAMLFLAFFLDRRKEIDYAKWLYIFGTVTFWTALTLLDSRLEFSKFMYCMLNTLLMFIGVLLERRVFTVFGALGVFGYIGHLAWSVFKDSLLFPFALTALGLTLVWNGWLYHKHREKIIKAAYTITPSWIISRLPQNRQ